MLWSLYIKIDGRLKKFQRSPRFRCIITDIFTSIIALNAKYSLHWYYKPLNLKHFTFNETISIKILDTLHVEWGLIISESFQNSFANFHVQESKWSKIKISDSE